jgi:predicted restriction endonuclease
LASLAGTSSWVASQATTSRPATNAPGIASEARGPRSRVNNSRSGSTPTRRRPRLNAVDDGTDPAAARIGQHRFARDVLRNNGHQCVFCGLAVSTGGVRASRMLIASHIKPWKVSSNVERLDVRNGLAACPSHDVAFDTGLITVNGGLRIHVKAHLSAAAEHDPATRSVFGRPPLAETLRLPSDALEPQAPYLAWHHNRFDWTVGAEARDH